MKCTIKSHSSLDFDIAARYPNCSKVIDDDDGGCFTWQAKWADKSDRREDENEMQQYLFIKVFYNKEYTTEKTSPRWFIENDSTMASIKNQQVKGAHYIMQDDQ